MALFPGDRLKIGWWSEKVTFVLVSMSARIVNWSMIPPTLLFMERVIRSSGKVEFVIAFSTHEANDAKADTDVTAWGLGEFGMLWYCLEIGSMMVQSGCNPLAGVGGPDPVILLPVSVWSWWVRKGKLMPWWDAKSGRSGSDLWLSKSDIMQSPDPVIIGWSTLDRRSFKCCSMRPWSMLVRRDTDGEPWRDPGKLSWMIRPPVSTLERLECTAEDSHWPSRSSFRSSPRIIGWLWLEHVDIEWGSATDVDCRTERREVSLEHVVVTTGTLPPLMIVEKEGRGVRTKTSLPAFSSRWRRDMLFKESISMTSSPLMWHPLIESLVVTFFIVDDADVVVVDVGVGFDAKSSSSSSSSSCETGDIVSSTLLSAKSVFFDVDSKS